MSSFLFHLYIFLSLFLFIDGVRNDPLIRPWKEIPRVKERAGVVARLGPSVSRMPRWRWLNQEVGLTHEETWP
ncbi:hypothetical protein BDW42DRAFT_170852 [Aspergillus taichungensis]|uniref:Uncharacterized protein n=1 Tax=Aspergillus taichungensis TaxID=482145 RepID=A0A2J5HT94_9EURO|nr:hypothetical protein BDW42DRAFT_170852 [Aspergillus taichungensis]